jgi:hypothetical protein
MHRLPSGALPTPAALAVDAGEPPQQAPFGGEPPLAADELADQALQGAYMLGQLHSIGIDALDEISPWRRLLDASGGFADVAHCSMSGKDHRRPNVRRSSSAATLAWTV